MKHPRALIPANTQAHVPLPDLRHIAINFSPPGTMSRVTFPRPFRRADWLEQRHTFTAKSVGVLCSWSQKMKRLLLAGVGLLSLAVTSALAADLPARMPTKAPAFVHEYNWSGWYLGLEGDGDWSDMRGSTAAGCTPDCVTRNNWLATFRGRIGHAFDRVLPYVTGGLAVGDVEAGFSGLPKDSDTRAGWTVGGGVEWAIAGPWTAKVEYLYADLGKFSCSAASCGGVAATDVDFRANILRGGINYRFGPAL
jgi:outer membrane immunogenic protein